MTKKEVIVFCLFILSLVLISSNTTIATNGCSSGDFECGSVPTSDCDITENTIFNQGFYNVINGTDICAKDIVLDCNGAVLDGNGTMAGVNAAGITVTASVSSMNVTIKNCNVINYPIGIYLVGSTNSTILNNYVSSNWDGIKSIASYGSKIISNNANLNYNEGISLFNSHYSTVKCNIASSNFRGISLASSFNNVINNTVNNNVWAGISFGPIITPNNNTLINNTANSNGYGLYVFGSSNNILSNNIYSNVQSGLYLISANSNIITQNNIFLNAVNGIRIISSSKNNIIYNNNLISNTQNVASFSVNNSWYFNNEGNYWSDFDTPSEGCYDINNDFVCDDPYTKSIDVNNLYPFVVKNGWNCFNNISVLGKSKPFCVKKN